MDRRRKVFDLSLSAEQQKVFDEHFEWAKRVGRVIASRRGVKNFEVVENYALFGLARACKLDKPEHDFKKLAGTQIFANVIQSARDNGYKRGETKWRKKNPAAPRIFTQSELLQCLHSSPTSTANKVDPTPTPDHVLEVKDEVAHLMKCLHGDERRVIELYFFDDLALHEIGKMLGVSESRACQIRQSALNKMRRIAG